MYNCYSGIQTARECKQQVSPSGANNGNVIGYMYKDSRYTNLRHKAEFTYDSLNRLASSIATPVSPGTVSHNLDFSYGRYGNATCVTDGQTNGPCPNWTFNSNNQISTSGFSYDAAGNTTADGSCSYTWDAEGRLTSVGGTGCGAASYTYNALGQRVEKLVGSTYTEIVYGAFGQTLAFHNRSTWTDQFFYLGATPFAKYQGNVTYFIHGNRLGSTTMVYNHTGGTVVQDEIFYPWGERWAYGGALYDERFASLGRRDAESTLDPTLSRMYESRLYRWLSPDPIAGSMFNPQSLNRYAYVLNNPTNLIDPLGLTPPRSVSNDYGGGGTCYLYGVEIGCSFVLGFVGSGAAVVCPMFCVGVNGSGQPVYYFASAVGAGYFTYWGPGSLYYSYQAAGAAASLADQQAAANGSVMREYGEVVYALAGVYSFSRPQMGPPCDLTTGACGPWSIGTSDIPPGAVVVGLAHNHPGTGFGSYSFSEGGWNSDIEVYIQNGFFGFVATEPAGRVLMFDPNRFADWMTPGAPPPVCVLQGPAMGGTLCR